MGLTYETLDFVNSLQSGKVTPWLATSYAWSNDNKTLTFTIRPGVKWSDGKPFSAADVVYTFNLLKKYPALDVDAVWSVLSSVTQKGTNQVVFNFAAPAVPYFYYVAGQTPIVPEHIWSSIKNPVTDAISNPIGTGGYVMSHCTPQNIQWTANPNYWQKGKAQVGDGKHAGVPFEQHLQRVPGHGSVAVGLAVHPEHQDLLRRQEGGEHLLVPAGRQRVALSEPDRWHRSTTSRFVKRSAMALIAQDISVKGEYGYEPPASQVGIVSPTFSSWTSSAATAKRR